jgi:S1-C subfamily serine protease
VRGDIILEINGQSVNSVIEMREVIADLESGEGVELIVLHGDETRTLQVELEDLDGYAFLDVGTCNFARGSRVFPGDSMVEGLGERAQLGAQIMEVTPQSPAEDAGLVVGDWILSVDQKPLGLKTSLADLIQKYEPGDTVQLEVRSEADEGTRQVEVTLGENPDSAGMAYLGVTYQMGVPTGLDGEIPFMEMFPFGELPEGFEDMEGWPHFFFHHGEDLEGQLPEGWDEDLRGDGQVFELPELPEGLDSAVIISEVMEDTPAADAGLQANDLIIALDGDPIQDVEAFVEQFGSHQPGDRVTLTVLRNGEESQIQVTLAEHPDNPEKGYLGVLAGTFKIETILPEEFDQDYKLDIPGVPGGDA